MKRTNIYLDESLDRLLRHYAIEQGRSFTDIVREALQEYAARHGIGERRPPVGPRRPVTDPEWQAAFDAALERIRSRIPTDLTLDEIEAEISAAVEEVRQERLTHLARATSRE